METRLKHIEVQDADSSDTYRALLVYPNGGEALWRQDFRTIGEAYAILRQSNPQTKIYNCTGRKTVNKRNIISPEQVESGELG